LEEAEEDVFKIRVIRVMPGISQDACHRGCVAHMT